MRVFSNSVVFIGLGSTFIACADPVPAKDVGFNKPAMAMRANTAVSPGVWMDVGPADLTSCPTDVATTAATTLHTQVADFQSGDAVGGAVVTAFPGVSSTDVFDTQTSVATGGDAGNVTLTIPAGTKRYGIKMTGDFMPTFLLNQYVDPTMVVANVTSDPNKIQSVSTMTAETIPAIIGQTRTLGTGVIAGTLLDCAKHEVSNFIATVSSTSGTATPAMGGEAYYFAPDINLPVRHDQEDAASQDGLFVLIQLPAAPMAYVQLWGYPTDADVGKDLKLITELAVPVVGDTVITGSYEPKHD